MQKLKKNMFSQLFKCKHIKIYKTALTKFY